MLSFFKRFAANQDPILWSISLLGLAFRLIVFVVLPDPRLPDAHAYVESGQTFLATGVIEARIYMPLYPIWTAFWGHWYRVADISASVAAIFIVYGLAAALFRDRRSALLAALAVAIYPHFLFYAVTGLSESLYITLLLAALLFYYRSSFAVGHVFLVLSILTRPTFDIAAPLLILIFSRYVHHETWRVVVTRLGLYAIIYVLLMTPWWAHNQARYGQFVRLNLGDGIVLYSGNNPLNQSGGGVTGTPDGKDDLSFDAFESIQDPIARNHALKAAALDYIRENPRRFIELAGIKFLRFWRLWPYAPAYETLAIIVISLLSFGPVLAGTIAFILSATRSHLVRISPLLFLATFLTAVHMATIGSIRYRLPLEPLMIILAAAWAVQMLRKSAVAERLLRRASL